jgi:uncharacterized glyoxalase superfamily protein PhnB
MLANRSMPSCTVIPELAYDDLGQAIDWLCTRFGFTERWRAGSHRAQLAVGDGAVVVMERPDASSVSSVLVRVEALDRARILRAPAEYPYGERQYTAEDLAGHVWTFSQTIADVAPEEWGGTSHRL